MTALADRIAAQLIERSRLQLAAREGERERLTRRQRYALDPFALIDDGLVRIIDGETREVVVLNAYPYQRRILADWIDIDHLRATGRLRFRNVIVEKSRQMGVTWILAYAAWWAVNYHDAQGVVKARKSSEVDNGGERSNWRSFFGKVRFIHRHLLRPEDAGRARLRFIGGIEPRIQNLDLPDSWILGEGETPDPGRGGTFTFAVLDEAAFVAWGESVHAALDRACPVGRAYVSSANGRDNVHYRLARRPPKGWARHRIHWSEHPVYGRGAHIAGSDPGCHLCAGNQAGLPYDESDPRCHRYPGRLTSPWFDQAVVGLTDEQVARELEIDYEASVQARVYPEAQREVHLAAEPIPLAVDVTGLEAGIDYGLDCTAVVIAQDLPGEHQILAYLKLRDQTPDQVARALRRRLVELGVEERHTTAEWTRHMLVVGDPSGEGREVATGRSAAGEYRRLGFNVVSQPRPVEATIRAVKRLLRGVPKPVRISPAHGGEQLYEDLAANKWPTDRTGARKLGATRPLDDDHNHGARALAYLVAHRFPPPVEREPSPPAEPDGFTGVIDSGLRYGMTL